MEHSIAQLLKKYLTLHSPLRDKKKILQQAILETVGEDVPLSGIVIQKDIVFLAVHPTIKTALLLQKQSFDEKIKEKLPELPPFTIR